GDDRHRRGPSPRTPQRRLLRDTEPQPTYARARLLRLRSAKTYRRPLVGRSHRTVVARGAWGEVAGVTPARILHALAGAPEVDGCAPVEPCRCYMCAAPTERGAPVRRWMGSTFTDQPRCACPSSDVICEACVWACSWVVPPGHEPPPPGKKGVNLRLFSHLYDAGEYRYANKADKPSI